MKILHLATVASSHRYLLLPQLEALVEAGHDVVAVSADGEDVQELERRGIRFIPLGSSTRGFDLRADLQAARSFVKILRQERPDLVHTHNPKPGIYGRIAARLVGVPRVVNTVHGLYAQPEDPFKRRAVVYGLEGIASRFSHLELVQSIEDVELMQRTAIAPAHRVRHLGNGIRIGSFTPNPTGAERSAIRAELGLKEDAVIVASVGRLVAEKGFGELLEASTSIDADHQLVVIGPSDPEKADGLPPGLIAEAERRGARFIGHRTDIPRLLPAFDVFALATYREGFPRAAMEAAASGLPVVATDIRGCRQVVDDGVNGFLVPARQAQPLATAMEKLIVDPELRAAFGTASRAKAVREFDEADVIKTLMASYEDLGVTSAAQPSSTGQHLHGSAAV